MTDLPPFATRLHAGTFYLPGESLVFVGDNFTDHELDARCVIEAIERIDAPDGYPEAFKITARAIDTPECVNPG